jgi:glutamine synthetase type III
MYVTWNTSKKRHNEVAPNQFELAPILKKQTQQITTVC